MAHHSYAMFVQPMLKKLMTNFRLDTARKSQSLKWPSVGSVDACLTSDVSGDRWGWGWSYLFDVMHWFAAVVSAVRYNQEACLVSERKYTLHSHIKL